MKCTATDSDQEELLRILETHGQQFLNSFDTKAVKGKRKNTPDNSALPSRKRAKLGDHSDLDRHEAEEWHGFSDAGSSQSGDSTDDNFSHISDEEDLSTHSRRVPDVVVFSENNGSSSTSIVKTSKAQMKAFMSSKVEKLRKDISAEEDESGNEEGDDEISNVRNDALLHRLIHTKLLSGSLNDELDLTPAQKKKALAGRVLEAAEKTKLGKGESIVRSAERNRHAKHIRDGLLSKEKERNEKKLEEAKNMGNYHPALKSLFDTSSSKPENKRRERGLKLGVGSFSGGILKLRQKDIAAVTGGSGSGSRGKGKKRGGRR